VEYSFKTEGYIEFKQVGQIELCPVSNATCCEECTAKVFKWED